MSVKSAKPPSKVRKSSGHQEKRLVDPGDSEALNLKHDLDLQRLLQESHLLDHSQGLEAPAQHRHRATDLRLLSLGSKISAFGKDKMPMAHRKGILAKAGTKEAVRRQRAKEDSIVLEKPTKSSYRSIGRRERGIDGPSVGKFRGGTLNLSKNDISSIQGTKNVGSRPRKRGR
jgi:hypothetical protein